MVKWEAAKAHGVTMKMNTKDPSRIVGRMVFTLKMSLFYFLPSWCQYHAGWLDKWGAVPALKKSSLAEETDVYKHKRTEVDPYDDGEIMQT